MTSDGAEVTQRMVGRIISGVASSGQVKVEYVLESGKVWTYNDQSPCSVIVYGSASPVCATLLVSDTFFSAGLSLPARIGRQKWKSFERVSRYDGGKKCEVGIGK